MKLTFRELHVIVCCLTVIWEYKIILLYIIGTTPKRSVWEVKLCGSLICLFFGMLSKRVFTTRHWQTSGHLVQQLNACTVYSMYPPIAINIILPYCVFLSSGHTRSWGPGQGGTADHV